MIENFAHDRWTPLELTEASFVPYGDINPETGEQFFVEVRFRTLFIRTPDGEFHYAVLKDKKD